MTKNDPKNNYSRIKQNGQNGPKRTKWTRKVVPMMGQKYTMKRPAYNAGARDKEKKEISPKRPKTDQKR